MAKADTLAGWLDWWITCRCACGRSAAIPVRLMADRIGANTLLNSIGPRLRCDGCGGRPADVQLEDRPQYGASGFVGGGEPQRRPLD